MERYLEALQAAAVALVTSGSRGREAVRRHRSKCLGDGNLWESRTLCRYTCNIKQTLNTSACFLF